MSRPKLLHVATTGRTIQSFLLPYLAHFAARGWTVDVAGQGLANSTKLAQCAHSLHEIPFSRSPRHLARHVSAFIAIRRLLVSGRYDIVHVHTPIAAFITRFALGSIMMDGRTRLVYTAHGFHFYRGQGLLAKAVFTFLELICRPFTDALVTINRQDYQAALSLGLCRRGGIHHHNGIGFDHTRFDACKRKHNPDLARSLGLGGSGLVFLMVASFDPGKRHRDVLMAFARTRHLSSHLLLAGDGPLADSCRRLAGELGLSSRVHFLGYRRDVDQLMGVSDVSICASEREGLSVFVMESMAMGIPVIGTDARGVADLVDEESGWRYPVGDIDALVAILERIGDNPSAIPAKGAAGSVRVKDYETAGLLVKNEEIYNQLLSDQ